MITIRSVRINKGTAYYINDTRYSSLPDIDVAKILNIDYELYIEIMKKYGATKYTRYYYFYNRQDAINCLKGSELEPYLIMEKLMKE